MCPIHWDPQRNPAALEVPVEAPKPPRSSRCATGVPFGASLGPISIWDGAPLPSALPKPRHHSCLRTLHYHPNSSVLCRSRSKFSGNDFRKASLDCQPLMLGPKPQHLLMAMTRGEFPSARLPQTSSPTPVGCFWSRVQHTTSSETPKSKPQPAPSRSPH